MSKRFIRSPRNPDRPATAIEMMRLFGVTGSKWPNRGCPARCIQDVWVHVLPIDHESLRGPMGSKARRAQHRCIASCPSCGATVSASRLAHHICTSARNKVESLRRLRFRQTLGETGSFLDAAHRDWADAAERAAENGVVLGDPTDEFPEDGIDSQPLKQLSDDE
jgi:hypothetical protein